MTAAATTATKDKILTLITGANKGIGYEMVKALLQHSSRSHHILLACRSEKLGQAAIAKLEEETSGGKASGSVELLCPVDLCDNDSIVAAARKVKEQYPGGLHLLINNAGLAFKGSAWGEDVAKQTFDVNLDGTHRVSRAFFPLLRDEAKVINVASMAGTSALKKMNEKWRKRFLAADLTEEQLWELRDAFIADVKNDTWKASGWSESIYGTSKAAVIALTLLQSRQDDIVKRGILVNAVCPGWCSTDMSSHKGPLSAAEGASRCLELTEGDAKSLGTGHMFSERKRCEL